MGKAAASSEDAVSAELLGVDDQAGGVIVDGTLIAGSEATSGLAAVLSGLLATDVIPVASNVFHDIPSHGLTVCVCPPTVPSTDW